METINEKTMRIFVFLTFLLSLGGLGRNSLAQTAIPYGSNNGKYREVNGVAVLWRVRRSPPLFVIHGGLSLIESMAPVLPGLSQKFRVIAVDCPGQGRSEQAETLSYQLMADYFSKMLDLMQLDSAYVFGFSDGGNVALLMASDRPDKVKKVPSPGLRFRDADLL